MISISLSIAAIRLREGDELDFSRIAFTQIKTMSSCCFYVLCHFCERNNSRCSTPFFHARESESVDSDRVSAQINCADTLGEFRRKLRATGVLCDQSIQ